MYTYLVFAYGKNYSEPDHLVVICRSPKTARELAGIEFPNAGLFQITDIPSPDIPTMDLN